MLMDDRDDTFESTRARLEEIAEEVKSDDITLDEALALYEEAVNLGLAACDLSEQDILAADAAADDAPAPAATEASDPSASPADAVPTDGTKKEAS